MRLLLVETSIFDKDQKGLRPAKRSLADKINSENNLIAKADFEKAFDEIKETNQTLFSDNNASKIYQDLLYNNPNGLKNSAYLNYLKNLDITNIEKETASTIYKLIIGKKLNGTESFLYDQSLFSESDEANCFKIKTLTYFTSVDNNSKVIEKLKGNNGWKTSSEFKSTIAKLDKKAADKDALSDEERKESIKQKAKAKVERKNIVKKQGYSGAEILKTTLGLKRNQQIPLDKARDYMKSLADDSNLGTIAKQLIDAGDLDDEFDDLMDARKYKSNIGRSPLDILNKKIADAIQTATEKSFGSKRK